MFLTVTKDKTQFKLPTIRSYPSRKEWENACWQKILKSKDLDALLTPYERRNVVMRVAVADRVHSGKKYRQIAEELWLSPQTISSIKKALHENTYRSYRERGKTERKKKVYSSDRFSEKSNRHGRRVRTKYGIVNLPG